MAWEGKVKVKRGRCKVKSKVSAQMGPEVTDEVGWIELLLVFMVADACGFGIVVAIHPCCVVENDNIQTRSSR